MGKLKKAIVLGFLAIFILSLVSPVNEVYSQIQSYDKEVLIVQSYQRDYEHTRALENGIGDYFEALDVPIRLHYEFLDTKKETNSYDFQRMSEVMTRKYAHMELDGVILCDDDALNFHLKYGEKIWPNVKNIVATGINSVKLYENLDNRVKIIEELPDIEKTIEAALMQNDSKDIDTLNFIYDVTVTSKSMKTEIELLLDSKYKNFSTNHYADKTPDELKHIIESAGENQIFFFVVYSMDRNKSSYYYDEVPKYLTQYSENPIYGLWEFYMGTGLVGGYMSSSYTYGEDAANMIKLLWEGKNVPNIQYENGTHQEYIFDYNILKAYGITEIPRNSTIINKPESYFEKNKTLIIIFSFIIGVLITIILLLSFVIRQKNYLHLKNQEIVELNKDIIDTQKDLISRLGDVIETRSHETASHVKRVAEISKFLAIKYGLAEADANILATISPMHDIGKIGIPEEILHKPGKLTDREFSIMKYHTNIGYEILKSSDKEILKKASIVALEHHEKWDGTGYPNKKSGEDIDIFARITAIADVYDAVRSDRVYKKSWPFEQARVLIESEYGKQFEPKLTEIFLENIYEIEKIREQINKSEIVGFNQIYNYLQLMAELSEDTVK